jgi:hypothetical protein
MAGSEECKEFRLESPDEPEEEKWKGANEEGAKVGQ